MSSRPIPGMKAGESLNEFHDRCIVPSSDETNRKNAAIDKFVRFLQDSFKRSTFSVSEVHKSGSLGKGTAVKNSADIDLVVFFNGFGRMKKLKQTRTQLLNDLKEKVDSYEPWHGRIELQKKTKYFLSYSLDGEELDILPAYDVVKGSQNRPVDVYHAMSQHPEGPKEAAQEYSVSLAPLQINFVKPQTDAVKRVIRLVKYWKTVRDLPIRSYTLELVTIYAARSIGKVSTDPLFKKVMELLRGCPSLRIAFDDNYVSAQYTGSFRAPCVLDPANPFMNTLHGLEHFQINKISEEAKRTLELL